MNVVGKSQNFTQEQTQQALKKKMAQNNNNNNNNVVLVARGGRKSSIPAIRHGTLKDGRKGDPQQ